MTYDKRQYYILDVPNLELTKLDMRGFLGHLALSNNPDNILLSYNPDSGFVLSTSNISEYWFHDIHGKLGDAVQNCMEDSDNFVDRFTDFGQDLIAASNYNYAINNNLKYYPRVYEAPLQRSEYFGGL